MKTKQLAIDSMLAAMCCVLGMLALDFGNLKITFESVPIILGSLLFGPVNGMAIGFIGTFIYQLLRYGLSATTLLWMLPYVVCGLIVGICAKNRSLTRIQLVSIVVIAELIVTTLNTGVMYIDSKVYGYYSVAYVFGSIVIRYIICIGKAIVEGCAIPLLTEQIQKQLSQKRSV